MTNRDLIALAAAATVAAPAAQSAKLVDNESTTLELYGTIEPRLVVDRQLRDGRNDSELDDNDSTIGLRGERVFSDAVTGFFKAEFEFDADEENDDGIDELDEAFVGVKGEFGKARVGSSDTIFEDQISELLDELENAEPAEERNNGEGNQITYFSPDFGGFSFAAEARFLGENEDENPTTSDETGLEVVGRYDAPGDDRRWGVIFGVSDQATARWLATSSTRRSTASAAISSWVTSSSAPSTRCRRTPTASRPATRRNSSAGWWPTTTGRARSTSSLTGSSRSAATRVPSCCSTSSTTCMTTSASTSRRAPSTATRGWATPTTWTSSPRSA